LASLGGVFKIFLIKEDEMKMPPEILTRLLLGERFDIEQRRSLGLWPSETLRYSELLDHLSARLEAQEWFPRPPAPSETIYVHRRGPNEFACVVWPGQGAKATERVFPSSQEAADFYLKWELHLPGSLDSWPVVDNGS
jgi:hypothetical protein